MTADTKAQIEKKTGSKVDVNNASNAVMLANKLSEDEFLAVLAGDSENLPALQLTEGEMALLRGGWGGPGWSVALTITSTFLGAIVCANMLDSEKVTASDGKPVAAPTKK